MPNNVDDPMPNNSESDTDINRACRAAKTETAARDVTATCRSGP